MDGYKKTWEIKMPKWAKIVGAIIVGLVTAVLLGFIFGIVVQYLWNWLMPEIFGLAEITYWQAFGIVILAHLIFGSFKGSYDSDSKSKDRCHEGKGNRRNWEYYDEWWEQEGEKAFNEYAGRKKGVKEDWPDKEWPGDRPEA
jgi:hypothetical protein